MIFDAIENAEIYFGLGDKFKKAFEFLQSTDFDSVSDERIDISGDDVFALIQNYSTKELDDAKWEKHEKYVDIQYMVSGTENIGFVLADYLDVIEEYDEEKDVEFLDGDGDFLQISEGEFVVFFPDDAHMPGLKVDVLEKVQKVVIKIKL